MNDIELITRKLEAIVGLYHPDVPKFIYFVLKNFTTHSLNFDNLARIPIRYGEQYQNNSQIYEFSNEKINSLFERKFNTNVAFSPSEKVLPQMLFISKSDKTKLPPGYIWQDDENVVMRCIINLTKFEHFAKSNPEILRELHIFLNGFEYFLRNCFLPTLLTTNQIFYKEYMKLPVMLAFNKVFKDTPYSLNHYAMNIFDKKEIEWFKTLKLNLDYLAPLTPELSREQVSNWLKYFNGQYIYELLTI